MKHTIIIALLSINLNLYSQLSGVVADESGQPLPYVSIYVKGTSQGTTTNLNGEYQIQLDRGKYTMVFQYVGMQTQIKTVTLDDNPLVHNITLSTQATILNEITIAADAEDPAYRVIRNAMSKREYYRDLIKRFSCDVYVKGNQKLLDAPEKIMGVEIGDFEGALDSNRQGIVYLSESISKLYYEHPDKLKEIVYSSKISGDDRGYSFNSAREMEFNIYENTLEFNRQLVSPIANNAFTYYRYRLEGTFYDEEGRLINKIKLLPKRETDPVLYGTIYIIEDLWNVHSVEVGVTGKSSQLYFIDSLRINQVYIPISEPDVWRIFNNNISFLFSGFGFRLEGYFTAVYSDYDLNPNFEPGFFNREIFVVEKDSNKKDSLYWQEVRPSPLTIEEKVDYIRKDSIQEIRDSPAYKDSVDRKNNKIGIGDILGGYQYSRSSKNFYWNIDSPLEHFGFNTVQGFHATADVGFRKYFDEDETKRILFNTQFNYGFSEKKLRANARLTFRPDRLTNTNIFITGGQDIKQYNKFSTINELRNTLYSVFVKRNYPKYYGYDFAKIGAARELWNGVILNTVLGYEQRTPLVNNSDFSFFYKDSRQFTSNDPLNFADDGIGSSQSFDEHRVIAMEIYADIRFKQEYFVYPDRKFNGGNTGPDLRVKYRHLYGIETDMRMHNVSFSLSDEHALGGYGTSTYFIEGGSIFDKNDLEFIDYFHFRGNQFTIPNPSEYSNSFLMLPYYSNSTDGSFIQVHLEHNFNGYILDKIPVLSNAGWSMAGGIKYLHSSGHEDYYEWHIGIDKIGWHMFRLLRFDIVRSYDGNKPQWGYRIGIKL